MTSFNLIPGGSDSKEAAYNVRQLGSIPGSGRSPGEYWVAVHSSILVWEISCAEAPGGLLSMKSQKSQTDFANKNNSKKNPQNNSKQQQQPL